MEGGLETTEDDDNFDWEDGSISIENSFKNHPNNRYEALSLEFEVPSGSGEKKPTRRASAQEKELAENVHKVNLLCLTARGRLIDHVCDYPIIQASLLSLLPIHLVKIMEVEKPNAVDLAPIVNWFHQTFHFVRRRSSGMPLSRALNRAIYAREGTSEEVAALSVALFRALNFTTRFVSILDVTSLKPTIKKSDGPCTEKGIFSSPTLMVPNTKPSPCSHPMNVEENTVRKNVGSPCCIGRKDGTCFDHGLLETSGSLTPPVVISESKILHSGSAEAAKRKGDVEFEEQMAIALSATGFRHQESSFIGKEHITECTSSFYRPMKRMKTNDSSVSSQEVSTAIGSIKDVPPLHWAEVFCSGENLTGKWVHVDTVNLIVDGEQNVESAVSACRKNLRYVVAFAGHGAKDVTRRYCMKWHRISSLRVSSIWWDRVLEPLKRLESSATTECVKFGEGIGKENREITTLDSPTQKSKFTFASSRSELEDLEFETRELTEPLPTNQQAYRSHKLYAIEKWLTKYQILYPRGPILGFCSGHPVYPRTSVQTLKSKERWFREGIQVKSEETPAKVLKQPTNVNKNGPDDDGIGENGQGHTFALYGKWQTEEICLPRAINGIVPKNERGRVDVWCEKCIPPGTVHLRLPSSHISSVAARLGVDFAPAMVGFDRQNGRSFPLFDGIVVCSEFKDAILEAYGEEEEVRREAGKRKTEAGAVARWHQLLSSMLTRQRLTNSYGGTSTQPSVPREEMESSNGGGPTVRREEHEHVFLAENRSFDEETAMVTKRCICGFYILVEEL